MTGSATHRLAWRAVLLTTALTAAAACAPRAAEPKAAAPVEAEAEPAPPPLTLVNATVVIDQCPQAKTLNTKLAQRALQRLVEPCSTVPAAGVHFMAELQPGGQIEVKDPPEAKEQSLVPTCVLKNLHHEVPLAKPCTFDVRLEERKVAR